MQPKPSAETTKPCPKVRVCIFSYSHKKAQKGWYFELNIEHANTVDAELNVPVRAVNPFVLLCG
jgi:hypothetical protein